MKKVIITSVLIVGLAAGFAYAHGNGNGTGNGNNMMGSGYSMGMMGGGYAMMGPGMMGGYERNGNHNDYPGATSFGPHGSNGESSRKFLEETVDLRKGMNEKRFEYVEAQRNPNSTKEQIATLEKELIDIRTKLSEKAEQYR